MASIVVAGDTSGTVTLAAPSVAGTTTLTLPTANGTIITTGSSGQSIPKAALPTGSVLQVVQDTFSTQTTTTSTSFVTSGLTASITPTSSSSKIFALATFVAYNNFANQSAYYTLYRNSTNLFDVEGAFRQETSAGTILCAGVISFLDSPATTSSTTYTVYMKSQSGSVVTYMALSNTKCIITLMEIAA